MAIERKEVSVCACVWVDKRQYSRDLALKGEGGAENDQTAQTVTDSALL